MEMLSEVVGGFSNVEVGSFDGLLVDYAAQSGASVILRGIRAVSDYEYELQMALMNRRLRPEIETVFLMAGEAHSFGSPRMGRGGNPVRGNTPGRVPPLVGMRTK